MLAYTLQIVGNCRLVVLELDGPGGEVLDRLRPSEREVAKGLLAGRSQAEIAQERGTSKRTVANQIARIFEICEVGSKLELARAVARASAPPTARQTPAEGPGPVAARRGLDRESYAA